MDSCSPQKTMRTTLPGRATLLFFLIVCIIPITIPSAYSQEPQRVRVVTVDHGAKDPAVSPDGAKIAVTILGKIWIMPRSGGEARQISQGVSWDTNPAWSPDGQFLAYAHDLPSGSDLVIHNLKTGHDQLLYHSENQIQQVAFTAKGDEIFFLLRRNQYDSHLWRISVTGAETRQLTEAQNWHETSFALSPDGKHVLLDSGRYGGSNLYMLDLDPFKSRRLTHTPNNQNSVQWSRDGKQLAYIETVNGRQSVMLEDATLTPPKSVYSSSYGDEQLALDPDGRSAVLCSGRKLYTLDLNSGALQPIAFTARFNLPEQSTPDLLIIHARVITGRDAAPLDNATIEIRGGKIARVSAGAVNASTGGLPVLDAAGKTVVAGLMDNHYHFWEIFDGPRLLARGITSIRDPGSDLADTMNSKEAIALGLVAGPHIYTTGPLIDGLGGYHPMVDVEIDDPAAAADLVRALKAQGVDALKAYFMLKPEVVRAVVSEAHAQGLRVTGHLGVLTSWTQAMDAGIDGFNHIRLWPDFLPASEQPRGDNESLDAEKNPVPRMQADWSRIDPNGERAGAIISQMIAHHIGFDPTLSIQRIGDYWRKSLGMEQFQVASDTYVRMGQFVARAQKMGVLLLAGTDDGSLFDEMESYATAGVPNPEIVKAATVNGAKWLGKDAEFGTIETGKRADLVIVDGDPLKDIKTMRKISAVIQDGRVVFKK